MKLKKQVEASSYSLEDLESRRGEIEKGTSLEVV